LRASTRILARTGSDIQIQQSRDVLVHAQRELNAILQKVTPSVDGHGSSSQALANGNRDD
jgi:hypothetical protein